MKYLLFTSSTCAACPAMKANLAKAGIEFIEVDADKSKSAVAFYSVRSLPILILVDVQQSLLCGTREKTIETLIGVCPVSELVKIKERYQCQE